MCVSSLPALNDNCDVKAMIVAFDVQVSEEFVSDDRDGGLGGNSGYTCKASETTTLKPKKESGENGTHCLDTLLSSAMTPFL